MPSRSSALAQESGLQPLNFRISAELRREFKTYAATHDLKLNELLAQCFESHLKLGAQSPGD